MTRNIVTVVIGLIFSVIGVSLVGHAYFGGDIQAAQTAFGFLIASNILGLVIGLCLGKPQYRSEPSYRADLVSAFLAKAGLALLILGAFAGQRWALGWAFWIDMVSLILVGLILLVGLGVVIGGASVKNSRAKAGDWRARV